MTSRPWLQSISDDALLKTLSGLVGQSLRVEASGIERLSRVLTVANRDALLERAAYKSKRGIERIIVEFAPQPDVATTIRKLPTPRTASPLPPQHKATSASEMSKSLGPDPAIFTTPEPDATPASTVPVPAKRPVVEPIAPTRYRVQFTASAALHEKLSRLQSLMRSSVPDGDLAQLIEEAVTEKLERLAEPAAKYDIDQLSAWCSNPSGPSIDCVRFLDAWNLMADALQGRDDDKVFRQAERAASRLYNMLFHGCNLPSMAQAGRFEPAWGPADVQELREVMSAGALALRRALGRGQTQAAQER